jgi:hypothetical protein
MSIGNVRTRVPATGPGAGTTMAAGMGGEHDGNEGHDALTEQETPSAEPPRSREVGGRTGPDPTRFGDWERNGRCIDF